MFQIPISSKDPPKMLTFKVFLYPALFKAQQGCTNNINLRLNLDFTESFLLKITKSKQACQQSADALIKRKNWQF